MLVIVEGVDRTGKSSLCERLRADYGGTLVHFGPPETHPILEYLGPISPYRPGKMNMFVDRHYLGELVWPKFFGRSSLMTDEIQDLIEQTLDSLGACCVLAVRDPHELNEACAAENEPVGRKAWLAQIDFQSVAAHSRLPWIEYVHNREGDYEYVVDQAIRCEGNAIVQGVPAWA